MAARKRKGARGSSTARPASRARTGATARKATRRKSRARAERVALTEAPAQTRNAILAGIRRLLRKHGIDGDVAQLQVEPGVTRAGAARGTDTRLESVAPCPDGQVLRVVCFFQQGTFVCEEQCVPA